MMKRSFFAAAAILSLMSTGCAIHPLPEDVTGVKTYHIVRQIRCESRDTLRRFVIKWLHQIGPKVPTAEDLALQYEKEPASIKDFHYDLFKGAALVRVRSAAKLFYDAGLAYSFDLTMTEDNNLSTDVNFLKPLTNSQYTLGLHGSANRARVNQRTFTATDTFSGLLTKVPEAYCVGKVVGPNYIYPIAGHIGIDAVIEDFINLTLFANLAGGDAKPGVGGSPPTMADKLTFTTTVSASAVPGVTFTPVTDAFQLTSATGTGLADRTDVHQVTVGVAIAPTGVVELDPLRSYLFSSSRGGAAADPTDHITRSPLIVGRRVIGGGSPSERLAVLAADQAKSPEVEVRRLR
ncbi:blr4053 [Bradyrhizobium diazoefficiens USDA 110]|uniref:Blr4053 protein n=2 Tax=Bradyrhizobium diazoefficiens TaxID=1355477 RepID=Q89MY9_BRADU|nr:hypothetical protein CO678_14060 [Bradyrhizobium diazoefficiens]QBP22822.1 hypothetical protein Bdiaspc4_20965 [Bradyrhizobium diazoefficiens]BAC49318.1 blr4053 [Bradyrhizobium diazoefficiens USDA 110]